jgi:hypothetical protein
MEIYFLPPDSFLLASVAENTCICGSVSNALLGVDHGMNQNHLAGLVF